MGRPPKVGLDYFFIDLDIVEDERVAFVEAKYGIEAFGILVKILIQVYKRGYFMPWSERDQYLFMKQSVNVDINTLRDIVSAYINSGFFNKAIADKHGVLTSHGIQKRYVMACERRSKVSLCQELCLLHIGHEEFSTDKVAITPLIVNRNPIIEDIQQAETPLLSENSTQSRVEKSRIEKKESITPLPPTVTHPLLDKHRNGEDRMLFDEVLMVYPKADDAGYAEPVFYSLMDCGKLTKEMVRTQVIPAIKRWTQSKDWQEDGGKWIPRLDKFLDKERWKQAPKPTFSDLSQAEKIRQRMNHNPRGQV